MLQNLLVHFVFSKINLNPFKECESYGDGKMKLGLIQTEVGLIQDADSALQSFYGTSGRTTATRISYLNQDKVLEISK